MAGEPMPASALSPPGRHAAAADPGKGGSIEALLPFLNLSTRNDFVLVVAWLLATLRAFGPYPLLAVSGEQGSAKTVLSKMLKALVDPNTAPVRALPRDERELMIAANNGYLLAFDNLSWLPPRLSDALCRLASGGSFAVRQLYTDDDEVLFQAARPLLLNGIEDVVSRPDLADRGIFLTLAPIGEEQRRSESELWREFERARPRILGALLDAVVHGLPRLPTVRLRSLPRMADFALWATACETALWPAGTFTRAYDANRKAAIEEVIESDPVAVCVRKLMAERGSWAGTASELLRAANDVRTTARARAGQKIPALSRGGYVGRRPSFACWGSKYLLAARDEREHGQSGSALAAGTGARVSAPAPPSVRCATTPRDGADKYKQLRHSMIGEPDADDTDASQPWKAIGCQKILSAGPMVCPWSDQRSMSGARAA